jgi:phosphatidylserine decarboxylase
VLGKQLNLRQFAYSMAKIKAMRGANLQSLLPQKLLCEIIGWLADSEHAWIRAPMIYLFKRIYQIDLSECTRTSVKDYRSFNDFFARELRIGARSIAQEDSAIAAPADGRISCTGQILDGKLFQAKGHSYQLKDLLVDGALAANYQQGSYATIYLAPANYHRVHVPLAGELKSLLYVPGRQFSVSPRSTRKIPQIYARNERLIAEFSGPLGNFCLVMVGALLVAGMSTVVTGRIHRHHAARELSWETGGTFMKGQEFGSFQMGSTVILLLPQGQSSWLPLETDSPILCGQAIGKFD